MGTYMQVTTTTASKKDAERIAELLVERRLAACVQIIGPVVSVYRWKGKIETAEEWQCLIKTSEGLFPRIERAIKEVHRYETPEIVAAPIAGGSREYLAWLEDSLEK